MATQILRLKELAQKVYKDLGLGYSESIYHNAFQVALRQNNISYETEKIIPVFYEGFNVGNVRADIVIKTEPNIVVELKSVAKITSTFKIQTKMYMKLLNLEDGLLINFPTNSEDIEFEKIFKD